MTTATAYEDILSDLYAGALDPTAWHRAVSGIMQSVRASAGTLLAFDPSSGQVLRNEDYNVNPGVSEAYARNWAMHDVRLAYGQRVGTWEPMTEQTLNIPGWERSAILNEFLVPVDSPHIMPVWLHKSARRAVALSLQGSRKRGPFERADLELFARLAPHVTRALEIRERLAAAALSSKSMGEALSRNRVAVMMLDARGSILQANALASAHLAKGGPMRRKSDGTLAVDGAAGRTLLRWLGNGAPEGVGAEGSIRVPREGRVPLSLSIAPFPDAEPQWFESEVRWLLTIADPEQAAQVSVATLSELYGLTAREAEVAALVATGLSPPVIASRHGTSVHTVRTQLKAVFRKTGWHTQADLIRNLVLMSGG